MSRVLRRALSTAPAHAGASSSSPVPAAASSSVQFADPTGTLPRAVKLRRERAATPQSPFEGKIKLPSSRLPLPGSLEVNFQRLRAEGQFSGDEASARRAFLLSHSDWRSRIRGHKKTLKSHIATGGESTSVSQAAPTPGQGQDDGLVAKRIYLPNIQIRLMRNHTPPDTAYDPMVATFRIPPSMTKTDLRSYLHAVYGLEVTFIRTDNYLGSVARLPPNASMTRQGGSKKNYKRAVVGLKQPFVYPDDVHEMSEEDRARREEFLQDNFQTEAGQEFRKKSMMKLAKGWRWRTGTHDNQVRLPQTYETPLTLVQGNVMREIMKRRQDRERAVADAVASMTAGTPVAVQPSA
jgi:large subunit ribosomal protein L23